MTMRRRDLLAVPLLAAPLHGGAAPRSAPELAPGASLDPASGESRALARYVARTRFEDLPPDVVDATRRAILDAIGVSLGASGLEPACRPVVELAASAGRVGPCTILGTGRRASAEHAALANGAFAHALDYEDAHEETFTHPNAATVAAALPIAELRRASGRELIVAVALGCDLVCRLARARAHAGPPEPGFYPPAIVGTFGAATAAAKLLGLDERGVLDAWSLALCQNSCSAELQNCPESQLRAVRDGLGAQAGVTAALLAERGVRGFDAPFEGASGFYAMYERGRARPGVLLAELGRSYAGRDVAFKAWPSCRASHAYVQAALELQRSVGLEPGAIASVVATVAPTDLIVCEPARDKRRPRNAIAAKFSLYFTVASALAHRKVDLGSFSPDALADPDVLAIADRVAYRVDGDVARPRSAGGGDFLEVRTHDGRVFRRGIDALHGSVDDPMPLAALVEKFVDCGLRAAVPRSRPALSEVAATLLALDAVRDVRPLVRRL